MKKWIFSVLFFITMGFVIPVKGMDIFSPATKRLLMRTEALILEAERLSKPLVIPERLHRQYPIHSFQGESSMGALLRIDSQFDVGDIQLQGVTVRSRAGDILSISIPLRSLRRLESVAGIVWVDVDTPIRKRLDLTAADVKSLQVHQGTGLSQAYMGTGVVIGIIDGGFDYTHPVFQDGIGNLRIAAAWDQADTSGTSPDEYKYGSEYVGPAAILSKAHDLEATEGSHGSHVCGIAGGWAADDRGIFWGMAPDADLLLVSLRGGRSDVLDGIDYVFDFAESQNLPAVINMSLGEHIGPHDGSSLMDRAFDRAAGPGKILVGAAGNEADLGLHLSHVFTGDMIATGPEMIYYEEDDASFAVIDMWGSPNTDFSVAGGLFNTQTGAWVAQTDFYNSNGDEEDGELFYAGQQGEASIDVWAVARDSQNERPNMLVELMNTTPFAVAIQVTSANSTVHLWHAEEAPFSDLGYPAFFKAGDADYTVGEIGGTGKSVLSVGAYTTKNAYTDINGQQHQIDAFAENGQIAPFSSHGPTLDGRLKPEITAPGNVVVSAISSYDEYTLQEEELLVDFIDDLWPFAAFEGTSMSAPVITGIAALMLEANPTLTKIDIVDILKKTAKEDGFTGELPDAGSMIWGYGKVDALEAVKTAVDYTHVSNDRIASPRTPKLYANYPNPFNPVSTIQFYLPRAGRVRLIVFDLQGREKSQLIDDAIGAGMHTAAIEGTDWASGVYVCRLETANCSVSRKVLLVR